ncbi:MAG TPA: response regulator [Nitrososphaeraceae archaeon]|nr:response regulator [Nitrososphaeraceae archaeon]
MHNQISKKNLIAIVDDEDDIVNLFREALGPINGNTVFTFTDPVVALEHFKINAEKYILVISDLRMPALTGMELIKELKTMNQFVRTILMTAFMTEDELFQEYTKRELINGFLQKPIHLDDLRLEVNNQLHAYELLKQEPFIKIK